MPKSVGSADRQCMIRWCESHCIIMTMYLIGPSLPERQMTEVIPGAYRPANPACDTGSKSPHTRTRLNATLVRISPSSGRITTSLSSLVPQEDTPFSLGTYYYIRWTDMGSYRSPAVLWARAEVLRSGCEGLTEFTRRNGKIFLPQGNSSLLSPSHK